MHLEVFLKATFYNDDVISIKVDRVFLIQSTHRVRVFIVKCRLDMDLSWCYAYVDMKHTFANNNFIVCRIM
jgi:hypothetical protein